MNEIDFIVEYRELQKKFKEQTKELQEKAIAFVDDTSNDIEDRESVYHAFDLGRDYDYVTFLPDEAEDAFHDMHISAERYETVDVFERISWCGDDEEIERLTDIAIRNRVNSFVNDW